jgi:hypothetical protein
MAIKWLLKQSWVEIVFQNNFYFIIFFYFLKFIFDVSASKQFKNIKKFYLKQKNQNVLETRFSHIQKHTLNKTHQSKARRMETT